MHRRRPGEGRSGEGIRLIVMVNLRVPRSPLSYSCEPSPSLPRPFIWSSFPCHTHLGSAPLDTGRCSRYSPSFTFAFFASTSTYNINTSYPTTPLKPAVFRITRILLMRHCASCSSTTVSFVLYLFAFFRLPRRAPRRGRSSCSPFFCIHT